MEEMKDSSVDDVLPDVGAAQQSRITAFYAANQSNDQTIYDLKKKKKNKNLGENERGATDRTNEAYKNVADH